MEISTIEICTASGDGLMSHVQYVVTLEACYILCLALTLVGIVSNIISIKVFINMGVNDGVTVSFLALAIFDLAYLITTLSLSISLAFFICEEKFKTKFHIDPFAVYVFSANVMIIINLTNILTTTFLAVVRCLCVAKPLHFKNTITKQRTTLFMAGIAIFSVIIYMPVFVNMGMTNTFNKSSNTSRPSLWLSPQRNHVKNNIWIVTDVFLPILTQVVILVCIIIMVRCLHTTSKFRQSSGRAAPLADDGCIKYDRTQNKIMRFSGTNSSTDKLTGKDRRVVQQVVLIFVVYMMCSAPKILISLCTVIEPEFIFFKRYANFYSTSLCLRKHFEIFNASVNLIIYYKYNRKFRSGLCMWIQDRNNI